MENRGSSRSNGFYVSSPFPTATASGIDNELPSPRLKTSLRTTFLGLAVNAILAAVKNARGDFRPFSCAGGRCTPESLADVLSSIVVWRGVVVAEAPADEDHPYGHGKAEPLAAAVVAIMLITGSGVDWRLEPSARSANRTRGQEPFTLIVLIAVIATKVPVPIRLSRGPIHR